MEIEADYSKFPHLHAEMVCQLLCPRLSVQRFGLGNAFKRTILDMITNELLQRHASAGAAGSKSTPAAEATASTPQNSNLAATGGSAAPPG